MKTIYKVILVHNLETSINLENALNKGWKIQNINSKTSGENDRYGSNIIYVLSKILLDEDI